MTTSYTITVTPKVLFADGKKRELHTGSATYWQLFHWSSRKRTKGSRCAFASLFKNLTLRDCFCAKMDNFKVIGSSELALKLSILDF